MIVSHNLVLPSIGIGQETENVGMAKNHHLAAGGILGWQQCWLLVARCHVLPLDL